MKGFLAMLLLATMGTSAFAAVGCSLDDPDRDVKRLFSESTGYKTTFVTLQELGGETRKLDVEQRLGDTFDTIYENLDVPYAYYTVLKGKDILGYIHGVNQKGKFGVLQLVVATDLNGKILAFYYQKISSPEFAKFRAGVFTDLFKNLSLKDFLAYDVTGKNASQGPVSAIKDPSSSSPEDFRATLRGVKKNLILLDDFLGQVKKKG